MNVYDFVGVIGALIIAGFYFYAQYRFTFLNTFVFFVGNIIGSVLIISSLLLSSFNMASFLIETLWIAVSFFGIYKYHVVHDGGMEDLTIRQDEFSIDGFKTTCKIRHFTREDLGVEILFKQRNGKMIPEKSMTMESFLFNGTTVLTPSAISNSTLGINEVGWSWRINKNCYFISLEPRDYGVDDIKKIFKENKVSRDKLINKDENKPILFFITGFMNRAEKYIGKSGIPDKEIFSIPRAGLQKEAAEYISSLNMFGGIIIDSISFEPNEPGNSVGYETTSILMNINESKRNYTPLVYHAKTPNHDRKHHDCSIRIGNVPSGVVPGYPVSILIK